MRQVVMNSARRRGGARAAAGRRAGQRARPRALLADQRRHRARAAEGVAGADAPTTRRRSRRVRPTRAWRPTTSRRRCAIRKRRRGASHRSRGGRWRRCARRRRRRSASRSASATFSWTKDAAKSVELKDGKLADRHRRLGGSLPGELAGDHDSGGHGAGGAHAGHGARRRDRRSASSTSRRIAGWARAPSKPAGSRTT